MVAREWLSADRKRSSNKGSARSWCSGSEGGRMVRRWRELDALLCNGAGMAWWFEEVEGIEVDEGGGFLEM